MTYLKLAVIAVYRLFSKPYTLNDFNVLFNRFPVLTTVALLAATVLNLTKEKDS